MCREGGRVFINKGTYIISIIIPVGFFILKTEHKVGMEKFDKVRPWKDKCTVFVRILFLKTQITLDENDNCWEKIKLLSDFGLPCADSLGEDYCVALVRIYRVVNYVTIKGI